MMMLIDKYRNNENYFRREWMINLYLYNLFRVKSNSLSLISMVESKKDILGEN
jgi:hypothetical protein